jgi:formyltetrahydrofolate deformylase
LSKRGTVAARAADLRDRDHTSTLAGADRHSSRRGAPERIRPLNPILRRSRPYRQLRRDHARIAESPTSRLLLACPDRPGLIAAVSGFLADAGLNIVDADQHSSGEGRLFMRMEFDSVPEGERGALYAHFDETVAAPLEMDHRFAESSERKRVAIMVSREDHCLSDLLWRWRSGELGADLVAVVSNHPDHAEQVTSLGLPFHHVPVEPGGKEAAERRALELLGRIDLLVLARYMQVLSAEFLRAVGAPAINIHHSFLPAFVGADPYRRAHERGVKLIGATAHYVTEELDAGPIIDQDVTRVSHRDEVADLMRIGRDIERLVLARAIKAHIEDRVLLDGDRTIVF